MFALFDQCLTAGGQFCHLWVADTAANFLQIKNNNYGNNFFQSALRTASGVTFSVDLNDLGILMVNNRIKPAQLKIYEPHIGRGRGFLTQFGKDQLVQFGTVGNGDSEQYRDQLKKVVSQLKNNLDDKTEIMLSEEGV